METADPLRIIADMLRMQEKLLNRYRRNEQKYSVILSKINQEIDAVKFRSKFVSVENGKTTNEYLSFVEHKDRLDKAKRLECLGLLDIYQKSISSKARRGLANMSLGQSESNLVPTNHVFQLQRTQLPALF